MQPAGGFSLSPHLPFEFDLSVLDALTNNRHVNALLHGTDYAIAAGTGSIDPMLATGTDAAGGKLNVAEQYNKNETDVPTTDASYRYGGDCRERGLRRPPFGSGIRAGGDATRWGSNGWYVWETRESFWTMRMAGFTGLVNELYNMSANDGKLFTNTYPACDGIENFNCITQLDSASLANGPSVNTPTAVASFIATRMLASKSAFKNSAVKYIIGAFNPTAGTTGVINVPWLNSFFNAMEAAGAPSALLPFCNGNFSAAISTGSNGLVQFMRLGGTGGSWIGEWSKDSPGSIANMTAQIASVAAVSSPSLPLWYCMTPQVQSCRHRSGWAKEVEGLKQIYMTGEYMIAHGTDNMMAHWVTWNDMAESPIRSGTGHQHVALDIASYYNYAFRTGQRPNIVRDVIYGAHRLHPYNATPGAAQTAGPMGFNGTIGKDIISMLAFCKAPCTVRIVNPDHSTVMATHNVTDADIAAGPYLLQYEGTLPAGKPYFQLIRDGVTLIDMQSDFRIRASITRFQDMWYKMCGSGRRSIAIAAGHPNIEPVELVGDRLPNDARFGSSG